MRVVDMVLKEVKYWVLGMVWKIFVSGVKCVNWLCGVIRVKIVVIL